VAGCGPARRRGSAVTGAAGTRTRAHAHECCGAGAHEQPAPAEAPRHGRHCAGSDVRPCSEPQVGRPRGESGSDSGSRCPVLSLRTSRLNGGVSRPSEAARSGRARPGGRRSRRAPACGSARASCPGFRATVMVQRRAGMAGGAKARGGPDVGTAGTRRAGRTLGPRDLGGDQAATAAGNPAPRPRADRVRRTALPRTCGASPLPRSAPAAIETYVSLLRRTSGGR
jgi:hypothetical protein